MNIDCVFERAVIEKTDFVKTRSGHFNLHDDVLTILRKKPVSVPGRKAVGGVGAELAEAAFITVDVGADRPSASAERIFSTMYADSVLER